MENGAANVSADAPSFHGIVERSRRRRRHRTCIGKNAIAEGADQAEHLVVSPTGLEDCLGYKVGSFIEGIRSVKGVVNAAAVARRAV